MNNDANYKLIAERLWSILDDIDTAFDHYKPDMTDKFVNYINHKCSERGLYANSYDGQNLQFVKDIPIVEDLDPMCKWFKDAWAIEKDNKQFSLINKKEELEIEELELLLAFKKKFLSIFDEFPRCKLEIARYKIFKYGVLEATLKNSKLPIKTELPVLVQFIDDINETQSNE